MTHKPLSLNTIDYPFETLVQRASSKPAKLILDPDFQRKYKWDSDGWSRASKFIESCLMRIPLPSCYFAETDEGKQLVIDGVQRITTIMRFMNDDFALEGLSAFPELEGKKFSELGSFKAELETTTIRCIVLRKENPEELITEIFARLNQGAVKLSDQEIRHALYSGPFDSLLTKLSKIEEIQNFGKGKSGKAKRDSRESEELVLRYFAFSEAGEQYSGTLTEFLDQFMREAAQYSDEKLDALEAQFHESLEACKVVFSDEELFTDISKDRRRQGVVYYDLLMPSLRRYPQSDLRMKRADIRAAYKELCASTEFKRLTQGGLQKESSVNKRTMLWQSKLAGAMSG